MNQIAEPDHQPRKQKTAQDIEFAKAYAGVLQGFDRTDEENDGYHHPRCDIGMCFHKAKWDRQAV